MSEEDENIITEHSTKEPVAAVVGTFIRASYLLMAVDRMSFDIDETNLNSLENIKGSLPTAELYELGNGPRGEDDDEDKDTNSTTKVTTIKEIISVVPTTRLCAR